MKIRYDLPSKNEDLRRSLYEGEIFQLSSTHASEKLVHDAHALLHSEFGNLFDVREVQAYLSQDDFFQHIGRVRKQLYLEPQFHAAVKEVIAAYGFDPERIAFDPIRLRVVAHLGHQNPLAASVYYPHRDTWYAHSQSMIAWWIPLHDLSNKETFVFYPDFFRKPVPNDSESFDYEAWVRNGWSLKIGWQDPNAGRKAKYPGALGKIDDGSALGFSCKRGESLLFSGAHLHETLRHAAGRTRFSLDFRIVHLKDHTKNIGAPNVDNRSQGSALIDYVNPLADRSVE